MHRLLYFATLAACLNVVLGQQTPSSSPHFYSEIPNFYTSFANSTAWQNYFQVKDSMPNITFPLQRSFAGNIPVNRPGHPNDTLFFYAFEKFNHSLTGADTQSPWIIWLNGGPGSSSLAGLFLENGPIRIGPDYSASLNNFSWNKAADIVWLDQPVGTGYSTADSQGYVADESQVAADFLGFLSNFIQVFPTLKTRPLYLIGESYAGKYIPYITKGYFEMKSPPVRLGKIVMGDGTFGAFEVYRLTSVASNFPLYTWYKLQPPIQVTVLQTYPQIIDYDPKVFNYFKDQSHLCGLDINLTYPQTQPIPAIVLPDIDDDSALSRAESLFTQLAKGKGKATFQPKYEKNGKWRDWKRDLSGRANGTIDPWYGCDLFDEMYDYAVNFTFPWEDGEMNVYNVPDALHPEVPLDPKGFLNDPRVKAAIHAPTTKDWNLFFEPSYPFGNSFDNEDASPPPINFLSELASNISAHNISWVLYSGNQDSLDAHRGTEITIQNITFGGVRGFTRKPSTPWFDDGGNFAGIVHQERGLTYVLFNHAGHQVPLFAPRAALHFLREFVLGSNALGSIIETADGTTAVGGENKTFTDGIISGEHDPIYFGKGATQFSTIWPSTTIALWDSFISSETGKPVQQ